MKKFFFAFILLAFVFYNGYADDIFLSLEALNKKIVKL
jgi:hypothetical protein